MVCANHSNQPSWMRYRSLAGDETPQEHIIRCRKGEGATAPHWPAEKSGGWGVGMIRPRTAACAPVRLRKNCQMLYCVRASVTVIGGPRARHAAPSWYSELRWIPHRLKKYKQYCTVRQGYDCRHWPSYLQRLNSWLVGWACLWRRLIFPWHFRVCQSPEGILMSA